MSDDSTLWFSGKKKNTAENKKIHMVPGKE